MTNQQMPPTLTLEQFESQLRLTPCTEEFRNTALLLANKYMINEQIIKQLTLGLQALMEDEDIDEFTVDANDIERLDKSVKTLLFDAELNDEFNAISKYKFSYKKDSRIISNLRLV